MSPQGSPSAPTLRSTWGGGGIAAPSGLVSDEQVENGSALTELLAEFRRSQPDFLPADLGAIERAYEAASSAHGGQRRRSGEPYLTHPIRVAQRIAGLGLDAGSVVAALLHDAVEDSDLTVYDVTEQFGREVANIVDGVTKLGKVPYLSRQEQQAESFRKMLLAMSEDIRVLIVKLLDRLDNMQTLEHMPADKQERISRETMQIYAPLAGRLGIEWVRRELQDLAFRYLEPAAFSVVHGQLNAFLSREPGAVDGIVGALREAFRSGAVEVEGYDDEPHQWDEERSGTVRVRATRRPAYRVHRRLEATGRGVDQISDVATFQVVTRDREACYAALGLLHGKFQPVPGRFRDYVALPRPNRYRALHTSVIDNKGHRIEVQIRSERMDAVAERGIVAQWAAKGGQGQARRLAWLGQLMDWQQEVADPHEFIEAVKADLFADEVYVFTPKGDIHTFSKGATPIDFAFAIHTDVGLHCSGARVNGHVVPLRYRLRQGDTVEILTNPAVGPREEWLKMSVSSRARAKIKHQLRHNERERLQTLGRSLIEQELVSRGGAISELESADTLASHAEALGLGRDARDVESIYEAVGAGQLTASTVADRVKTDGGGNLISRVVRRLAGRGNRIVTDAQVLEPRTPIVISKEHVAGKSGEAMITLASCCSPVPGDPLVGFFEPGHGIQAHVQGCPESLELVTERRVRLAWEPDLSLDCSVTLEVRTTNSMGLLAEMSKAFSRHAVNIKQANCRSYADSERAINTFHVTVGNLSQLQSLLSDLRSIEGVLAVERVFTRGSGVYPRA